MANTCVFHRYFTQGFPAVMFTHLIPFVGGVYKSSQRQQTLTFLILWSIVVYRFVANGKRTLNLSFLNKSKNLL